MIIPKLPCIYPEDLQANTPDGKPVKLSGSEFLRIQPNLVIFILTVPDGTDFKSGQTIFKDVIFESTKSRMLNLVDAQGNTLMAPDDTPYQVSEYDAMVWLGNYVPVMTIIQSRLNSIAAKSEFNNVYLPGYTPSNE